MRDHRSSSALIQLRSSTQCHCNQVSKMSIDVGCTDLPGVPGTARASLCCYFTARLKLSWLGQSMVEGYISICKCKYGLWVVQRTDELTHTTRSALMSVVPSSHTPAKSDQRQSLHCKMLDVLETLLYENEVCSLCFLLLPQFQCWRTLKFLVHLWDVYSLSLCLFLVNHRNRNSWQRICPS